MGFWDLIEEIQNKIICEKKLWHPKEAAKKAYSDKYGQNLYKALVEFSASHI